MQLIDHWREYEHEFVDRTMPVLQRIQLEHAFYSGAAVTLDTFERQYDDSDRQYHSAQSRLSRARAEAQKAASITLPDALSL